MLASMFTSASPKKSWFASKTLWFNFLTIAGTGLSWGLDYLTPFPMLVVTLVLVQAGVNIALRFITKEPIK